MSGPAPAGALPVSLVLPEIGTGTLRPVRPDDGPALQRFFDRMSPEDVRTRFFAPLRELPDRHVARLIALDPRRELALVIEGADGAGILAIGRIACDVACRRAEFAVTVRSDIKGLGIGGFLVRQLMDRARERGVDEFYGDILAENASMIAICRELGLAVQPLAETADIVRATRRL